MDLKNYFCRNFFSAVCICVVMAFGFSCTPRLIQPSPDATRVPVPTPSPSPAPVPVPDDQITPEIVEQQPPEVQEPKPRMLASLELTKQAKSFIAKNQADSAISLLEKAIALEPANGQNYFYLAEAWLLKGNTYQALSFNELAGIHLGSDEKWRQKIDDQRQRIQERSLE